MNQAYRNEAVQMMTRAGLPVIASYVSALAADLHLVAVEECDADDPCGLPDSESAYSAACILKQRIGGLGNLASYLKCIAKAS